jgi:hypothetical protein
MAFTGRAQGNLSLTVGTGGGGNRARVMRSLGVDLDDAVFMGQVHGAGVRRVTLADRGRGTADPASAVGDVDALVTTEERVALVVLAADCVPVLLAAPGAGVAAVHAGRRGIAAGVVGAAVAVLAAAAGLAPRDVDAVIGPAIGGCCYEVPRALAHEVTAVVPAARTTTTWGAAALDLPAAALAQLEAAGVERVRRVGGCTRCGHTTWFSHRASAAGDAPAGRQAGVVVLGAEPPPRGDVASLD